MIAHIRNWPHVILLFALSLLCWTSTAWFISFRGPVLMVRKMDRALIQFGAGLLSYIFGTLLMNKRTKKTIAGRCLLYSWYTKTTMMWWIAALCGLGKLNYTNKKRLIQGLCNQQFINLLNKKRSHRLPYTQNQPQYLVWWFFQAIAGIW